MTTFAILATGPSMSQAIADSVRGRCKVIAVSDAIEFAPWCDCLVSADGPWWREKAPEYDGARYTMANFPGIERVTDLPMGSNSGLLAIHVAVKMGATKVLLLGIDLHGTHFFGPHTGRLKNTTAARVATFHKQFANYKPRGVQIFNCNPDSHLKCYPMARLEDHLESMVEPAASSIGTVRCVQGGVGTVGLHGRDGLHEATR